MICSAAISACGKASQVQRSQQLLESMDHLAITADVATYGAATGLDRLRPL